MSLTSQVGARPIVRAKDVKEYFYCPRVVYFERVLRLNIQTEHLKRGREKHELIWSWKSSSSKQVEEEGVEYRAGVFLYDEELRLSGKIDFLKLIKKEGKIVEAIPIEIKLGEAFGFSKHHKMQLVAYAILVERKLGFPVRKVGVYYFDKGKYYEEPIVESEVSEVLNAIEDIRKIIEEGRFPDPTDDEGKCEACQYYSYCMGV